ncbi:class I SAM-dependent DNA methyltransferase [bacterium]|nr:class I SAM-dependent DNA methyltransferase [bacterium]
MAKSGINQKKAAKEFSAKWCGRGDEKQDTQAFWLSLLRDVFGVANPEDSIQFEKRIKLGHTSFIDAYIPSTKVLIEQKSIDVDLLKPAKQSDGSLLTPYQQADRYRKEQNYSEAARWIVTCNFKEFFIYDMDHRESEPEHIFLKDLDKDFARMQFLINQGNADISREEKISLKAGELVGKLYDALFKEYIEPDENSLRSLNILCVRIVFCLYAEDAGLFETRTAFEDYIKSFSTENLRDGIIKLFKILNTKPENRDKYDTKINSFPYTNGGLFADDTIEIPNFTKEIVDVIVNHCAPFDWSEISPTIFGAVFESTLNPETRRKGGMHYTSIENIHKVIDPLFMDDLRAEFAKIIRKNAREPRALRQKLEDFRNKLASLKFLDPACGSGNFLTETYISLRRLENECLKVIHGSQMLLSSKDFSPIKVKISQFYGIEINDFAVTVAKTALWIAESQMMKETEEIVEQNLDFLPLSTSATIVEGNALRMDWRYLHEEAEIPTITAKRTNLIYPYMVRESGPEYCASGKFSEKEHGFKYDEINLITNEINVGKPQHKQAENHYDYIMGNPPFVGARLMEQGGDQKKQIQELFGKIKDVQDLDYVCGWYRKAAELIQGTKTEAAFVSTNSICQGSQVPILWNVLLNEFKVKINFAYQTFKWDSESTEKAAVHCVIVGFAGFERKEKTLFSSDGKNNIVTNISPYLIEGSNTFVTAQKKPLCDVPEMNFGNQPRDGGHFVLTAEEKAELIKKDPSVAKFIKLYVGADEFINRKDRYCLWLKNATPAELKSRLLYERVDAVKKFRLDSKAKTTNGYAKVPNQFAQITQPDGVDYLIVPRVSSERRQYIPIGFANADTISSDALQIVPNATFYHFGILTSSVHMAWMRAVAGRLEMRYRYSKEIVYNTFPWPDLSGSSAATSPNRRGREIKAKIEQTAQAILDARAKYPDSSLADLYDETTMPPELRKAHKENDKAVMTAYGFNPKMTEAEIVAQLFKMYEKLLRRSDLTT